MAEPNQNKQSFLHGAALLTAAMIIVKLIGALYKIPLNAIIGEQGFGYFNTAYQIYSVLLLISTAGLPVAVSRMISEASSTGRFQQVRKIYKVSRAVFLILGVVSAGLMIGFSRQLANFSHQPDAQAAIACLGPTAFLVCLLSTYRGFFQGQSNMLPTSVSEVIEAVCKLIIGIAAAVLIFNLTNSVALAAGGAIMGVSFGAFMGSVYLANRVHKAFAVLPLGEDVPSSGSEILKQLLSVAIPISIGSAGLESLYIFETNLYMGQLLATGNSQMQADIMKGIYDMARTIYNMPTAFINPITISILPAITAHIALQNFKDASATEESAARIAGLLATPCAVGLFVLSEPIMALLGGYSGENLVLGGRLLAALGIGIYFYAVTQVTNTIMQANGHATLPVIHILFSGIVKLGVVYLLSGNPRLGIVGVPIGAALCNIMVSVLNLIAMRRVFDHRPKIALNFLRAVPAALIMGACVFGCKWGLSHVLTLERGMGRLLLTAVPILVGVAVYAVSAVKLSAITKEDCMLLPKGDKIAKILHL